MTSYKKKLLILVILFTVNIGIFFITTDISGDFAASHLNYIFNDSMGPTGFDTFITLTFIEMIIIFSTFNRVSYLTVTKLKNLDEFFEKVIWNDVIVSAFIMSLSLFVGNILIAYAYSGKYFFELNMYETIIIQFILHFLLFLIFYLIFQIIDIYIYDNMRYVCLYAIYFASYIIYIKFNFYTIFKYFNILLPRMYSVNTFYSIFPVALLTTIVILLYKIAKKVYLEKEFYA